MSDDSTNRVSRRNGEHDGFYGRGFREHSAEYLEGYRAGERRAEITLPR